ncbi:type I secretion system permease/ATPase [Photobacterium leiognathi]|uniref:type I secretion system permease/ATPase n=1 Tax=Photobacterium leiognathi TaxID=553611 RepID=UPI0029824B2B|nr:type I secretion system permease/ATPase [Photobacterium leiognathi]
MVSTTVNQNEQWHISASQSVTEDPLLDALVLISEYYGNPCSGEALVAGLPLSNAWLTPDIFPQAANRAGLKTKLIRKPLTTISAISMPCVLLLEDKRACILYSIDNDENKAVIQLPENGGETEITLDELNALYTGYAFLIKKQLRGDKSIDTHLHVNEGHWLWVMIKEASPIYRDALFASVLINLFVLISPLFMMNVYDKILPNLAFESLWVLATGAIVAFTFDFIIRHMRSYLIDIAGKKIDVIVSSRLFAKAMNMPLEKKSPSVGGMAKQLSEFDSVRDMLTSATITTLVDLPFALLFLFIIYFVSGNLAVIPLLSGVVILLYTAYIQPKLKRAVEESNKFSSLKNAHLIESLSAIESIKSNVAEGIMQHTWQQMIAHTADWQLKIKELSNSVSYLATYITQLTSIFVVILGVYQVSAGHISMGGIIAAVMLSGRVVSPMAQLASLLTRGNQTATALRQLDMIMQQEDEFSEKGHLINRQRLQGKITANHIEFTYPNSDEAILAPTSFTINPGERVAILGKNGSGKSSLAKMLAGLYQPTAGHLLFDGVESKQIHPADLRRSIGYMPQDITLIHGTIRDNIMFGKRQVTEHQLLRAIHLSGVAQFTAENNEGLDKQVGEGGAALSRGQRQAVVLARAILADPSILLMDEPTASMDASAEKQFIHNMARVSQQHTLILITHKMSLLQLVDRIIVLDKGHIIANGPRDQVLQQLSQGVTTGASYHE